MTCLCLKFIGMPTRHPSRLLFLCLPLLAVSLCSTDNKIFFKIFCSPPNRASNFPTFFQNFHFPTLKKKNQLFSMIPPIPYNSHSFCHSSVTESISFDITDPRFYNYIHAIATKFAGSCLPPCSCVPRRVSRILPYNTKGTYLIPEMLYIYQPAPLHPTRYTQILYLYYLTRQKIMPNISTSLA